MFKGGKILVLLFSTILLIGAVSAENLNNNSVNAVADSTFSDAQFTIDYLAIGDTVIFTYSHYFADAADTPIVISKNLTLMGLDTVVFDGKDITQIFKIEENCTVYLMNIEFINGKSTNGGALFGDYNSNITILNSKFINNSAVNGAAIYTNGNLTVLSGDFEGNVASGNGGGIYCGEKSNVLIYEANCTNNSAVNGGGIFCDQYSIMAAAFINFVDNLATDSGAGLYASNHSDSTTLYCNYINNSAKYGGAISACGFLAESVALVCNFTNNSATYGGVFYNNNGTIGCAQSTFVNNTAAFGGAGFGDNNGRIHANRNIFIDNMGKGQLYSNSSVWNLFNNTFRGNETPIVILNGVMENKTYLIGSNLTAKPFTLVNVSVGLYDDSMNPIEFLNGINITVGESKVLTKFNNKTNNYTTEYNSAGIGNYTISADISNFQDLDESNGLLETYYKTILSVVAKNCLFGETAVINATINAEGNLTFKVNNKNYIVKINNNKANLTLSNLSCGQYDVAVIFEENEYYGGAEANCEFKVLTTTNILVDNFTAYFGANKVLYAQIIDFNGQPVNGTSVVFLINGIPYTRPTNTTGWAGIKITLPVNQYNVQIKCREETKNVSVTVKSTIISNNVTKMFLNATVFTAQFLDSEGNIARGIHISFNINGKIYNRTTDGDGKATLNINLPQGNYIISSSNSATGETNSNKVTIYPLIVANNITKFFCNDTQFEITVYDYQGNIAPWQTVKININGVFYWKTGGGDGIVKLNIKLPPGIYIATLEYNGCLISNTVEIFTILEAEDIEMTVDYRIPFTVKVLDGQGKPLGGVNVTMNINGVFYNKTTNSSGIAELNINLPAGTYIITTVYDNLAISDKILIRP